MEVNITFTLNCKAYCTKTTPKKCDLCSCDNIIFNIYTCITDYTRLAVLCRIYTDVPLVLVIVIKTSVYIPGMSLPVDTLVFYSPFVL